MRMHGGIAKSLTVMTLGTWLTADIIRRGAERRCKRLLTGPRIGLTAQWTVEKCLQKDKGVRQEVATKISLQADMGADWRVDMMAGSEVDLEVGTGFDLGEGTGFDLGEGTGFDSGEGMDSDWEVDMGPD